MVSPIHPITKSLLAFMVLTIVTATRVAEDKRLFAQPKKPRIAKAAHIALGKA